MENKKTNTKIRFGVVCSDRMEKTRSVEVVRQFRHSLYDKVIRRRKRYLAHDEKNESRQGDQVWIRETRPLSRRKRWEIFKVERRSQGLKS